MAKESAQYRSRTYCPPPELCGLRPDFSFEPKPPSIFASIPVYMTLQIVGTCLSFEFLKNILVCGFVYLELLARNVASISLLTTCVHFSLYWTSVFYYFHLYPKAHHVERPPFIVTLLSSMCTTVLMSPHVHWPAPSSADGLHQEDSSPAPNSPRVESKKRKRADDNPISRCELCKQRKVRSHNFISSHVICFWFTPSSRLLPTMIVGDCAYAKAFVLT